VSSSNHITQLSRELRKNQTPEEKILWQELRNKKLNDCKFLRQHPIIYGNDHNGKILFFIADFYCHKHKLIIELDGKIHENQKEYDANRDIILKNLGFRTLRLKNEELKNIDNVKNKILKELSPLQRWE